MDRETLDALLEEYKLEPLQLIAIIAQEYSDGTSSVDGDTWFFETPDCTYRLMLS